MLNDTFKDLLQSTIVLEFKPAWQYLAQLDPICTMPRGKTVYGHYLNISRDILIVKCVFFIWTTSLIVLWPFFRYLAVIENFGPKRQFYFFWQQMVLPSVSVSWSIVCKPFYLRLETVHQHKRLVSHTLVRRPWDIIYFLRSMTNRFRLRLPNISTMAKKQWFSKSSPSMRLCLLNHRDWWVFNNFA